MARRGAGARSAFTDTVVTARGCDAGDCPAAGEFRAPRSRDALNEYLWFCLPHVREYNARWDYYRGMPPEQIEAHVRSDTGWGRPTWPLGRLGGYREVPEEMLRDPLGVLRGAGVAAARRPPPRAPTPVAPPDLRAALDVLGLEWPTDEDSVRTRYRELAKRFHPDMTGGDRGAEERFKDVNRAYTLLRHRLRSADATAPG